MGKRLYSLSIQTAEGEFMATYSDAGLCMLRFPALNTTPDRGKPQSGKKCQFVSGLPAKVHGWHVLAEEALANALAGRAISRLPPLDLSGGTAFRQAVWQVLRKVKCGETQSYGEVAAAVGRPGASRAVGTACGANPIPIFIPCHRIVASGGKLGGFSGGLSWKRLLLQREGVQFS